MKHLARFGFILLLAAGCSNANNPVSFSDVIGHGASGGFSDYKIIPIGSFNTQYNIRSMDINEQGTVVGFGIAQYFVESSFIWTLEDGFQTIPTPPGYKWFQALSINDNGVIGGTAFNSYNEHFPALLTPEGDLVIVQEDMNDGILWDVNNSNQAAVWAGGRAFFWSESSAAIEIEGAISATDINDAGQVLGEIDVTVDGLVYRYGYIWSRDAGIDTLTDLHWWGMMGDINNPGDVVGQMTFPSGDRHGFIRRADGTITDLGTVEGGWYSEAMAVNDYGVVVGKSLLADYSAVPFVWSPETGMVALPTMDGNPAEAWAINNSGVIAGNAIGPDNNKYACVWIISEGPQTPEEHVTTAIDLVNDLLSDGILATNQAKPLIGKLETALEKLVNENIRGAIGSLNAAVNQVYALINAGSLTEAQAAPLLEMLTATITLLNG